ncbi:MAG: 2-C-methyl-D-erythritol 4-phosphate cytidylyltransferase [Bacilli bacterium]|nr:2-C-methyl-D-erythritol 4-phosphate cytidylyltransferase [Bacilli bacterium]
MFSVVIVAAGSAKRTGLGYNKIFYRIKGKMLIEYSLRPFLADEEVKEIIIVVSKEDLQDVRSLFSDSRIKYVIGGSTRQKSVFNGLSLVNEEYVMIHDSARPNVRKDEIEKLKDAAKNIGATVLYFPAKDSVVEYSGDRIVGYLKREQIALIQTPQVFPSSLIKKAHSLALKNKHDYTDDASLYIAEQNKEVHLIEGDEGNIKATTKLDLSLLEDLL